MSKRIEALTATLTADDGTVSPATILATIAELRGTGGIEAEEIARLELASRVADGSYLLAYHFSGPRLQRVRVEFGHFVAPN